MQPTFGVGPTILETGGGPPADGSGRPRAIIWNGLAVLRKWPDSRGGCWYSCLLRPLSPENWPAF